MSLLDFIGLYFALMDLLKPSAILTWLVTFLAYSCTPADKLSWLNTLPRQQTRTTTSANRSTPPPPSTTTSPSVAMMMLSWSWLGNATLVKLNVESWSKALLVWQAEGLRSLWSRPGASLISPMGAPTYNLHEAPQDKNVDNQHSGAWWRLGTHHNQLCEGWRWGICTRQCHLVTIKASLSPILSCSLFS